MKRRKTSKPNYRTSLIVLNEGEGLPSEFRIWKAGTNTDRNGYDVVFDKKSAEMVMAAYAEHGVDIMIDLEHLSLSPESRSYNPDAMGWCQLELRNGELWAVNVRWNVEGSRRLETKAQRYFSPAFETDKDGRATRLFNIALTAIPATDHIDALVAANEIHEDEMKITLAVCKQTKVLLKKLSDAKLSPASVIKTLAEGDAGGEVAGVDLAALADFLGIDIDAKSDPVGFVKALQAKLEEIGAKLRGDEPMDAAPADDGTAMAPAEVAAANLVRSIVGGSSFSETAKIANEWRSIVANHETEAKKVAAEKASIELTERKALVARLVACRAETPNSSGLNEGKLVKRLAEEPIDALRARVEEIELANGGGARAPLTPATPGNDGLTDRERKLCAEKKLDPAKYLETKRAIAERSAKKTRLG